MIYISLNTCILTGSWPHDMETFSLCPKENPARTSGNPVEMIFPPYSTDYISTCAIESSEGFLRPVEGESHHQRASSDSFLVEMSWMSQTCLCTKVIDVHQVTLLLSWTQQARHLGKRKPCSKLVLQLVDLLGNFTPLIIMKILGKLAFIQVLLLTRKRISPGNHPWFLWPAVPVELCLQRIALLFKTLLHENQLE